MHAPDATSRLAREKSPYLLQHAGNPVDWYPWGDEAFARARAEDKPVFLSIGYATCHWCHVMERESFMHAGVAALLNADFICIKVDREERPDVDHLYMTAMQALGQGGGWPLNVFLTPDRRPFWGGTYFPPSTTAGRPGLMQLLPRLAEAWRTQREQVLGTGEQVIGLLGSLGSPSAEPQPIAELAARAAVFLEREHDDACGGFGGAPKFPSPGNLTFLLQRWARGEDGAETARRMVLGQLEAMRANGLHDVLGGGDRVLAEVAARVRAALVRGERGHDEPRRFEGLGCRVQVPADDTDVVEPGGVVHGRVSYPSTSIDAGSARASRYHWSTSGWARTAAQ